MTGTEAVKTGEQNIPEQCAMKRMPTIKRYRVAHLVGDVFSNQHENNVASMGIYCDEAHDALAVIPLKLRPRELNELVELIDLFTSHKWWNGEGSTQM